MVMKPKNRLHRLFRWRRSQKDLRLLRKLREALRAGVTKPITTKDLVAAGATLAEACQAAIVDALTDDADTAAALAEVVGAVVGVAAGVAARA